MNGKAAARLKNLIKIITENADISRQIWASEGGSAK
jgi:hypothetical protein